VEARLFAAHSRWRVFDVDDAIYVRKPRRLGEPADDSLSRRRKFAATCRAVDAVAAGNEVLADVARAATHAVEILPTSIDITAYQPSAAGIDGPVTIAWIGSPENLTYLEMIRPALGRLTVRHPELKLRVICSRFPNWPEINLEPVPWSEATEAASLAAAQIGIMPLTDDAWSRGKCAFKLLQYMAASLPCVASPVGANTEAVIDGFNGFHATGDVEWERSLERLIASAPLRARLGANGHAHVARRYSMRTYQTQYLALLARLADS
jgi:glycosyltransferase involved in cell wall biosynthesis